MSKLFKGAFVELSNLRKNQRSTNIDSWFTYCVLSQQNSVSVEFVLWTLWLRKYVWIWWRHIGSHETMRGPPPPHILLIFACGFFVKIEDFQEFCGRRKKLQDILNFFGKKCSPVVQNFGDKKHFFWVCLCWVFWQKTAIFQTIKGSPLDVY